MAIKEFSEFTSTNLWSINNSFIFYTLNYAHEERQKQQMHNQCSYPELPQKKEMSTAKIFTAIAICLAVFKNFLKCERQRERERECVYALVHYHLLDPPNTHNGLKWIGLKLGAGNSIYVSHVGTRNQST